MGPLTPNLVALPPEIITQILLQVDWKAILQMRQTCRDLFKISQTRLIWTTLLNECSQTMAYPPRLVEPIDNYSTRELETLVLTKISSEVGWGSLHLPSERAATKGDPQCYGPRALLEGGRWLLFHDQSLPDSFTGKISCCDLDSACLQVQPLLQLQTRIGDHRFSLQCIGSQADKTATSSSFIVAFQLQSLGGDLRNYQIYQIRQQGRGSGAHFAVRGLSSFTYINRVIGPSAWASTGLCLQGDYIMETPSKFSAALLQVFNWRTSTSTIHEKSILFFNYRVCSFSMIYSGSFNSHQIYISR
ncbi:hypothetical protein GALMADRAFT_230388 [Galerina marginata CBS 339.88]|uniref:F-box domain-containing protein n=1 Tax=Galerina marginata (strain CBS 339.88) TaxID=685588 RepID=A0A067SJ82_GALM3|nr:hypothetical protein GALMADRAFT_230388 [Galerina marginata CBS 339.88]